MKKLLLSISFLVTCFVYGQLSEKKLGTTASTSGYIEYLPPSYSSTSSQKLPVILFFHGSGESGNGKSDLSKIYTTGLPRIIKDNSWTYKNQFVVLMPQHDPSRGLCMTEYEIRDFIDFARQNYNIDPSRVYLTGLSCGANGLWRYLGSNQSNDKVAAAVPISGNGQSAYNKAGCGLEVPTWAFHGSADNISPAQNDIDANNSFQQCPSPHAERKFTLYQGVDHNAWDRTYDLSAGNNIYSWMLTKRSPSANQAPTGITLSATAFNENQPIGTAVATISTQDPDSNNTFSYSLEDAGTNNDKEFFSIDGNKLKTKIVFDYETKSNYRIKLKSTDQGGLSTYQWFDYIKIYNVNEEPTGITLSATALNENQPIGTTVGTFSTVDPDNDNTFTYSLEDAGTNNDKEFFSIEGNQLKTKISFDYENKSNYRIKVKSTDQGGLYAYQWFDYIKIYNINESPTDISLSSTEVGENLPVGTVVGTFSTTDPDNNNSFTYTLELAGTNNDINSFTIDGNKLKTKAVFNYNTKSNYRIKVRSTDQDGEYDEVWFDYIKVTQNTGKMLKPNAIKSINSEKNVLNESLVVYPNPAKGGIINIDGQEFTNNSITKVRLIDISGKQIFVTNLVGHQIDVSQVPSGVYILNVESRSRQLQKKIIIP